MPALDLRLVVAPDPECLLAAVAADISYEIAGRVVEQDVVPPPPGVMDARRQRANFADCHPVVQVQQRLRTHTAQKDTFLVDMHHIDVEVVGRRGAAIRLWIKGEAGPGIALALQVKAPLEAVAVGRSNTSRLSWTVEVKNSIRSMRQISWQCFR
ncbi:MAG: hypothetical protein WD795_14945 [Woeseia sp.]